MKEVAVHILEKISGGEAPIGVAVGGNPDQWAARVNVNIPIADNVYVVPGIVVDNGGNVHRQDIKFVVVFD